MAARVKKMADGPSDGDLGVGAHGLDPVQRILYLITPNRRLSLRNQAFLVEEPDPTDRTGWHPVMAFPHQAVDRIEIGPHVMATPDALRHAIATDTPIAFVDGHGMTQGWVAPRLGSRAGRHLDQARHAIDPALRLALATTFVDARLRNHRALLNRLNRTRQDGAVRDTITALTRLIRRRRAGSVSQVLGEEGRGAALFWPAFGRVLDHGFTLTRRLRRPAPDPVNILLNVTAHLLTRDITVAILRAGLHPGFGLLHGSTDGMDGAVYDLMEEFRAPLSQSVVAQAINTRSIGIEDFTTSPDGAVRLVGAGYAKIVGVYERGVHRPCRHHGVRRTWRGIMVDQAQALAAHLEGRHPYHPIILDY